MWNWCYRVIMWIDRWCRAPEAKVEDGIMIIPFRYHRRNYHLLVPYDRKKLLEPRIYRAGDHHIPHHPALPLLLTRWRGHEIKSDVID